MNTAALALTVALHSLLAASALVRCTEPAAAQEHDKPKPREGEAIEVRLIPSTEDGENNLDCQKTYRGIGIKRSWGGRIFDVVPGGPADKAGIRVDDVMVNDALEIDRYMVGHKVTVRVERDGRQFEVEVVIGRVCFSEQEGP